MAKSMTINGHTYLTGKSLRARWQRFRLRRAYSRPVTYRDLRKIAHDVCRHGDDVHNPDPLGAAIFDYVIKEAERPVFGPNARGPKHG